MKKYKNTKQNKKYKMQNAEKKAKQQAKKLDYKCMKTCTYIFQSR